MKAFVDADLCTGCGLCVDACPDVFEMQNDVSIVKTNPVPKSAEKCCKDTAADCPVEAIKIEE